jgi:hypothetical protein
MHCAYRSAAACGVRFPELDDAEVPSVVPPEPATLGLRAEPPPQADTATPSATTAASKEILRRIVAERALGGFSAAISSAAGSRVISITGGLGRGGVMASRCTPERVTPALLAM